MKRSFIFETKKNIQKNDSQNALIFFYSNLKNFHYNTHQKTSYKRRKN